MKTRPLIPLAIVLPVAVMSALACAAHEVSTDTPVHWVAVAEPGPHSDAVAVKLTATIEPGWHLYSTTQPSGGPFATKISLPPEQPYVPAGSVTVTPPPQVEFDENFHMNVQMHQGVMDALIPLKPVAAGTGADSVRVRVRYQACNATLCLPPQTAIVSTLIPAAR